MQRIVLSQRGIPDVRSAYGGRSARARCRLNLGFAADLCVQAMENLLPLTGGRGLMATDPRLTAHSSADAR
jgi:hypothetical protein